MERRKLAKCSAWSVRARMVAVRRGRKANLDSLERVVETAERLAGKLETAQSEIDGLRAELAATSQQKPCVNHVLKTWPEFFAAVVDGRKTFEVRRNDRNFAVGDNLCLREWNPLAVDYTGREETVRITYMLPGGYWGVKDGYVVLGVAPVPSPTRERA